MGLLLIKEEAYFIGMSKYSPTKIKTQFNDSKEDINHSSAQIRNIAKNALEGYISPNKAKNEISKLITLINELNIK